MKPRSHSFLVWVALWIVYIVWGSTYLAIRVTVETLPPLTSAGVRFLVAGAVVLAGVAVGFFGVAILVLPGGSSDGARLAGTLTLVAAALFWATGSFYSKRLSLPRDPFLSTGIQQLTGGVVIMAGGLVSGEFSGF